MAVFKLPRLPSNWKEQPQLFERYWDESARSIESALNSILSLPAINAAIAAATASAAAANTAAASATTAAATAQTSATTANTAATSSIAATALLNSYPTGVTLTATDAGANVTVTISAHSRVYPPSTTVSVNSGSLTALAYSTTYYIYYDDVPRTGGAVTYAATTSVSTAAQTGNRHLVGSVLTPAAAAAPVTGKYVQPPGVGSIAP